LDFGVSAQSNDFGLGNLIGGFKGIQFFDWGGLSPIKLPIEIRDNEKTDTYDRGR
jgi:hypothetical protein